MPSGSCECPILRAISDCNGCPFDTAMHRHHGITATTPYELLALHKFLDEKIKQIKERGEGWEQIGT